MLLVDTYIAPSPIHGIGLFAAEPIHSGRIWWTFDRVFDVTRSPRELEDMEQTMQEFWDRYAFKRNRDGKLVMCLDNARFVNHSDHPNSRDDDCGNSVACTDIDTGVEITEDYLSL